MCQHIKGHITYFCPSVWIHQEPFEPLHAHAFRYQYKKPRNYEVSIIQWLHSPYLHLQVNIMHAMHYWPFAWEYSIWNTTGAALQFWTADPKPHVLSNTIEWIYTGFFHSNYETSKKKYSLGSFVTTLNDTSEIELAQEDQGYESGSESLNIPIPLRRPPQIYHGSTSENLSFNPTTPLTTAEQHPVHSPQRFICLSLVFSSSDEYSPVRPSDPGLWHSSRSDSSPVHRRAEPPLPVNYHHTSTPSTDQFFH